MKRMTRPAMIINLLHMEPHLNIQKIWTLKVFLWVGTIIITLVMANPLKKWDSLTLLLMRWFQNRNLKRLYQEKQRQILETK